MIAAMDVTLVVVLRKATTTQPHHRDMVGILKDYISEQESK